MRPIAGLREIPAARRSAQSLSDTADVTHSMKTWYFDVTMSSASQGKFRCFVCKKYASISPVPVKMETIERFDWAHEKTKINLVLHGITARVKVVNQVRDFRRT